MSDFTKAIAQLLKLNNLKKGWNYGRGGPISQSAFRTGLFVLSHLNVIGASRFDILPSDDSGATILASFNEAVAEIVILKDGRCNLFIDGANEELDFEDLKFGELISVLEKQGWRSLKSSGSRTQDFLVWNTGASQAKPFPSAGMEHQLSTFHALPPQGIRFASISQNTIPISAEIPPYSNALPRELCLVAQS